VQRDGGYDKKDANGDDDVKRVGVCDDSQFGDVVDFEKASEHK